MKKTLKKEKKERKFEVRERKMEQHEQYFAAFTLLLSLLV